MYISNGFVCGGEPQERIQIVSVKPLDDMMMLIEFNNGETRLFDATCLDGSAFAPLREDSIFNNPAVEHGIVTWNNGQIDCAPEYMYERSFEYSDGVYAL